MQTRGFVEQSVKRASEDILAARRYYSYIYLS